MSEANEPERSECNSSEASATRAKREHLERSERVKSSKAKFIKKTVYLMFLTSTMLLFKKYVNDDVLYFCSKLIFKDHIDAKS